MVEKHDMMRRGLPFLRVLMSVTSDYIRDVELLYR